MSSANLAEKPDAHCSFCEKSFQEVGPLVEGIGCYICGECAELILIIIDEENVAEFQMTRSPASV
jgi:ATP-dependent Clp protease ATP-binding subunit ClpX